MRTILVWACLLSSLSTVQAEGGLKQLDDARALFDEAVDQINTAAEFAKLNESYFAGIAGAKEKAQAAGKLDSVLIPHSRDRSRAE